MAEAASGAMGGASMQRLASGYDVANRLIKTNSAKGRVVSSTSDGIDNIKPVGMLSAQVKKLSGAAGVAVELNSVKKDVIASMNKLPREVNVQIADQIRQQIRSGNWPIDRDDANNAIKKIIGEHLSEIT
ncbi:MAG: hypothetical protein EB086_03560 [Rhodobacteraceae bacterium]|nr:hypothetical protein [Paracoccaceae bacterium]